MLLKVSHKFSSLFSCIQLAVFCDLDGGSDFVEGEVESKPRVRMEEVAFQVLKKWKRECNQASSATLYNILKFDMKWEEIASELASGTFQ